MKLKRCILALVAMLSSFALTTYALVAMESESYVAKIGDVTYDSFSSALTAANAMSGDVTVEIYGSVEFVDGMELKGNYTSINFVGKDSDAQMTINQTVGGDYLEAHGKTVTFTDLSLAKANPAWAGNSGHMGSYFSIQGGIVTYNACTFPNGACTSGGTATYNDCTFQNASEYGLWAYDDALVTVDGGTFDSKKGIKVYSEDETSVTTTLTVKNATFTENVTAKPAVAVGYAQSITLIGNTYNNSTAHVELDSSSDADCEGVTFVAEDAEGNDIAATLEMVSRSNNNEACGVLVDGKVYTSVTTAAAEATAGSNVTVLYSTDETVEFAEGVNLTLANGVTAENVTVKVSGPAEVATYDELVAALANGGKIKLTADITVDTKITAIDGTELDLNEKTLYINVENSDYNNVTIKNGNIVLGKDDVHVCDGYFLVNEGKTLVVDGVNVSSSAEGLKGYAVFHLKTGANLDLINSTLNIADNEYTAGYIVYASEATATVDIVKTTITGSKVNGIVHATTVIDESTVTLTDVIEHGINRSGVTIDDSNVTISGGTGRGITAQHGDLVITGNSTVNISDMGEATIELRGDKNLTVAETATVTLDAEVNNTTSGTITGTVTVELPVAKIGETYYASLAEAIASIGEGDVVIELLTDATLDYNAREAFGVAGTTSVTINGNGKVLTLNQKDSDWASIGLAAGKLVLNNMTIEKTGYGDTTGAWNTHAIIFTTEVEMNDVTINNAIAVEGGATLNNVAINEANGYYGLWIDGNGQTVTLNGGSITATNGGRGIKIGDEYVSDVQKVTLNVTGTTFNTAKKAAVLVSSTAGANITASNVNIENVVADNQNLVWVDEDWAANYGEVTVTGGTVAQENVAAFVVSVADAQGNVKGYYTSIADALATAVAGDTVTILAGSYTTDVTVDKAITLMGETDAEGNNLVNIQGKLNITADGAGVKNLNVNNGSSTAGYIHAKDVLVEGCSVIGGNGFRYCYTDGTVTFKNSTITGSTYGIHFDGNAGGNIVIDNCVVTGWTSFAGTIENVAISKTTFANGNYNKLRLYQNATLTDCVFNENMSIDFGKNGTTADFSGCTVENDGNLLDVIYLADLAEMGIAVTVDGTPVKIVAKIGETYYVSLQAAVDAAQADDVISLIADVDLNSQVVISGKTLTLDLGEYTITDKSTVVLKSADDVWGLIEVKTGANVAVRGNGSIECNYANVSGGWTGMAYAINVDATSKLTVEGGTLTNGNGCIQTCGTLVVNGGTFVSHNGGTCIMAEFESASVTVNDGIFKDAVDASDVYTGSGAVWAGFGATVEINGGTYDFAADPENNNVVWTLFPAQNAIAGYGENAKMTVKGGTFANFNPATDVVVDYSASTGFTMGGVVADECASLPDLNGNYVVGSKPTATVNDLGAMTIAEADYTVYGGSKSGDMPLSFVMQFLADQTAEDMETSPYADWYGDFVITFEGLEDDFVADGCYLAGYYGSFGWVKVPVDGMTIEEGVRYPVMLGVGMGQKYDYICESVKDFRCALYLTPEVLAANPNIKVNLELSIVDNSKGEDAAAEALVNNTKVYQVGVTSYTAEDFAGPVAKIGDVNFNTLQAAIDAAQAGETITVLRDVTLTEGVTVAADDEITLNLNGKNVTYTSDVAGEAMITNNGNLTISGEGSIVYTYTGEADATYSKGNYTISNRGTLMVESGTIENATAKMSHVSYTIDNGGNGKTVISGGKVINTNNYAIRQFASGTNENTLTITGGEVSGTRAVWMQAAGSNTADAPTISLNMEGGKLTGTGESASYQLAVYSYSYGNDMKNISINIEGGEVVGDIALTGGKNKTNAETVVITDGTFTDLYSYAEDAVASKTINISGGTSTNQIAETYLAMGYQSVANTEGTYTVEYTGELSELVIVDGELTEFVNEQEMTVGKLTYKRTLASTSYNALYVPFEIPVDMLSANYDVFYIYDVRSYDNNEDGTPDDWDMEVFKFNKGTLKANYPYFIRPKSDAALEMELVFDEGATLCKAEEKSVVCSSVFMTYEVKGVYHKVESGELYGHYGISNKGRWIPIKDAVLSPFRFHLKMTNNDGSSANVSEDALSSMRIRVIGEGSTTDIEHLKQDSNRPAEIYDLQGRRVENPTKGFYIVNGKKVYIK